MTASGDGLRPAVPDDLAVINAVLRASDTAPPGEPPLPAGVLDPYLRHLIDHGTAAVAEVDGAVVGFGAAIFTGRATHLADLFVLPAAQGQGHGRRLLAAALGERRPRTTFSSDDPRAMPLYIRAGMAPLWPNLYVSGDPRQLPPASNVTTEPTGLDEIARLEAKWGGVDRSADVAFWSTLPGVQPFVVRARGGAGRAGRVVAAVLARARLNGFGRWIDRARVAPGEDAAPVLLAAVTAAGEGSGLIGACVPGPSPLLPLLLHAGFRIRDRDTYMASEPHLVDPIRELVNTGIL